MEANWGEGKTPMGHESGKGSLGMEGHSEGGLERERKIIRKILFENCHNETQFFVR